MNPTPLPSEGYPSRAVSVATAPAEPPAVSPPALAAAPLIFPGLDVRYTGATLEKCSRIQARQLIQVTYVTIAATLVAALMSGRLETAQMGTYATFVLTVGTPCVAAMFAAWCGNHDSIIALLDSYCFSLEEYGAALSARPDVPRWYDTTHRWFGPSVVGRYWSNVAFGFALFGASLPGTLIIYLIGYKQDAMIAQMLLVGCVLIYRFIRLPPSRQPVNTIRYYVVTAAIFVGLVAMMFIYAHVSVHDPIPHAINHPYPVLVCSSIASMFPMVVHIEFERRRLDFLEAAALARAAELAARGR